MGTVLKDGSEIGPGCERAVNDQGTHQGDNKCKKPSVNEEVLSSPLDNVQQCCH